MNVLTSGSSAWYELDVTSFINAEVAASRSVSTIGLHVVSTVNVVANFDSRETAYDPELVVTPVVSPPPPPAAPAAPSGLTATASSSQVDLAWTDNSDNEQGFKVQRSADSGSTWSTIHTTAADAESWSDTTVSPGQTYKYRVLATHTTADSGATNEVTVNVPTSPPPPTAPAAPSDLTATAASSSQVDLAWTDNSDNEQGFKVQRSADGGSTWSTIHTTAADADSWSDTTVSAGQTYKYRVLATHTTADSGATNEVTVNVPTSPPPPTAPAAPSDLTATAASSSQVDLAWTDNSTNETSFEIDRSTDPAFPVGSTDMLTAAADAVSFSNTTGLSAGTTYYYRVRATNGVDSADSNVASATTIVDPPATPTDLMATALSPDQIGLQWDYSGSNPLGFEIFYSSDRIEFSSCYTVPGTERTCMVQPLGSNQTSYFAIRALASRQVTSPLSTVASATTLDIAAPTGLTTQALSDTEIELNWSNNSTYTLALKQA